MSTVRDERMDAVIKSLIAQGVLIDGLLRSVDQIGRWVSNLQTALIDHHGLKRDEVAAISKERDAALAVERALGNPYKWPLVVFADEAEQWSSGLFESLSEEDQDEVEEAVKKLRKDIAPEEHKEYPSC
jgi:hypothetical protein